MPTYTTSTPKTGNGYALLEPGEYDFEVVDAKERISQSGNEMIELKLRLQGEVHVFDNLVFTEKALWKIDQFLKAVGAHPGEDKDITVEADDCLGHRGRCQLKIETYTGRNGEIRKNVVDAYVF